MVLLSEAADDAGKYSLVIAVSLINWTNVETVNMTLTVIVYECKPTELVPFPSEIKDESWTILQGEGDLVDR